VTNGTINLYVSDASTGYIRYAYHVDENGSPVANWGATQVKTGYYPTARGWYQTAVAAGGKSWSDVYYFSTGTLGITRSSPFVKNGQVVGVVTADFVLGELNLFMRSISIPASGKAFITEKNGLLIASSSGNIDDGAKQDRLAVMDSSDPTIAGIGKQLMTKYESFDHILKNNATRASSSATWSGDIYYLEFTHFYYDPKLDWIIVVIVPQKNLMSRILRATKITMSVSAVTLVLSALFAFVMSTLLGYTITRPLEIVSEQMLHIGNMDLLSDKVVSSLYEFGKMQMAMDQMKQGLNNYKKMVPKQLLDSLEIHDSSAGVSKLKSLTLLCIDIQEFNDVIWTQGLTAGDILLFMNRYLNHISPIIKKKGAIAKIQNTSVIAVFHSASHATDCALELQKNISLLNLKNLRISCAICNGDVTCGLIGDKEQIDVAIVSDTLLLLRHAVSVAKTYRCGVVVSGDVLSNNSSLKKTHTRMIGKYNVTKGKTSSKLHSTFELHEVIPQEDAVKFTTSELFNTAVNTMANPISNSSYLEAIQHLEAISEQDNTDKVAVQLSHICKKLLEKNIKIQRAMTILNILSESDMLIGFEKYCQSSFSDDNIKLWKELQHFKTIQSPDERIQRAHRIYNEYIESSSDHSVNLKGQLVQQITESIQKQEPIEPNFFDNLQMEVEFLMNDTFKRYKETETFQENFYASDQRAISKQFIIDLNVL
jgi:hypothetical protein